MARSPVFRTRMTNVVCNVSAGAAARACRASELVSVLTQQTPAGRRSEQARHAERPLEWRAGNVLVFVKEAMRPSRYVNDDNRFAEIPGSKTLLWASSCSVTAP